MAVAYNPKIVTDGLILLLDAANPKSYPGTGNTWFDISGKGNHSNIVAGQYVSAGYFQSTGDAPSVLQINTPTSSSLSSALTVTSGGWTIEEIVLVDDTTYPESTAGTTFGATVYNAGSIGFDWAHGTASMTTLNLTANDGTNLVRNNISLNAAQSQYDKWIYRTFIYDRTNKKIDVYYDAVFQNSLSITTVTGSMYNGSNISWGYLYGWQHDGFRAGMKIYNRILTTQEINQNFNAIRGRYGL